MSDNGQIETSEKASEALKSLDCGGPESFKCLQDWLPRHGLPIVEGYVEGILHFILKYEKPSIGDASGVLESAVFKLSHFRSGSGVDERGITDKRAPAHWQDALMLISDVEPMEIEKAVLPTREWLNLRANKIEHGGRGAVPSFYMSLNGAFYPSPVFGEGESAVIGNGMPVRFDENAVCVIQGSPEIMDGIAEHGWRVAHRLGEIDASPLFESAMLILGAKSFSVLRNVSIEKPFKLVDVMLGPFHLQ